MGADYVNYLEKYIGGYHLVVGSGMINIVPVVVIEGKKRSEERYNILESRDANEGLVNFDEQLKLSIVHVFFTTVNSFFIIYLSTANNAKNRIVLEKALIIFKVIIWYAREADLRIWASKA